MMTDFNETPEKTAKSAESGQAMPAEFGLATATFVVVAGMVGAGVLTTSGYTVALVGSNQWMLFLWVLGGITAVCGALTLAELSAALPRTGGDYVYLYEAYGPLPAFLSGWVSFLIGFAGPSAAAAFAFAKYILAPFPGRRARKQSCCERVSGDGRDPGFRGHSCLRAAADGQGAGLDHDPEIDRSWGIRTVRSVHRLAVIGPTSPTSRPWTASWP